MRESMDKIKLTAAPHKLAPINLQEATKQYSNPSSPEDHIKALNKFTDMYNKLVEDTQKLHEALKTARNESILTEQEIQHVLNIKDVLELIRFSSENCERIRNTLRLAKSQPDSEKERKKIVLLEVLLTMKEKNHEKKDQLAAPNLKELNPKQHPLLTYYQDKKSPETLYGKMAKYYYTAPSIVIGSITAPYKLEKIIKLLLDQHLDPSIKQLYKTYLQDTFQNYSEQFILYIAVNKYFTKPIDVSLPQFPAEYIKELQNLQLIPQINDDELKKIIEALKFANSFCQSSESNKWKGLHQFIIPHLVHTPNSPAEIITAKIAASLFYQQMQKYELQLQLAWRVRKVHQLILADKLDKAQQEIEALRCFNSICQYLPINKKDKQPVNLLDLLPEVKSEEGKKFINAILAGDTNNYVQYAVLLDSSPLNPNNMNGKTKQDQERPTIAGTLLTLTISSALCYYVVYVAAAAAITIPTMINIWILGSFALAGLMLSAHNAYDLIATDTAQQKFDKITSYAASINNQDAPPILSPAK